MKLARGHCLRNPFWVTTSNTLTQGVRTATNLNLSNKENDMPTYVCLMRWTQQGISKVKESASRLDAGRQAFKNLGVEIKDVYLTMGQYDLVAVIEGPDDAVARALLSLASQGNIQTETLRAWKEDEYRKITGSV